MPLPWQCSIPGWVGLWAAWFSEKCPCSWQDGCNVVIFKVCFNPGNSRILCLAIVHVNAPKAPGLLRFSFSLSTNGLTQKQPQKCSSRKVQTDGWCSSDPALRVILQNNTDNICHLYFSLCYWKWRWVASRVLLWMWLINLQHWFRIFCSTYLSLVYSLTYEFKLLYLANVFWGDLSIQIWRLERILVMLQEERKIGWHIPRKLTIVLKLYWSPKSCAQVSMFK